MAKAQRVQDLPRLSIVKKHELDELVSWITSSSEVTLLECDLASAVTEKDAIKLIGKAVNAPDYFGENLDALIDVLNDREAVMEVLVIRGFFFKRKSSLVKLTSTLSVDRGQERYGDGDIKILLVQ